MYDMLAHCDRYISDDYWDGKKIDETDWFCSFVFKKLVLKESKEELAGNNRKIQVIGNLLENKQYFYDLSL